MSLWFDGHRDVLTISNNPQIADLTTFAGAFAVNLWVRPAGPQRGVQQRLMDFLRGSDGLHLFIATPSALSVNFQAFDSDNDGFIVNSNAAITKAWTMITACRTANELAMWINGVKQAETETMDSGVDADSIGNLVVGGSNASLYYYRGHIAELAIWGQALTQLNINSLYNGGAPAARVADTLALDNERAFWPMDDADPSSTVADLWNSHDLTTVGAPQTTTFLREYSLDDYPVTRGRGLRTLSGIGAIPCL